jgi:hypothetical protein
MRARLCLFVLMTFAACSDKSDAAGNKGGRDAAVQDAATQDAAVQDAAAQIDTEPDLKMVLSAAIDGWNREVSIICPCRAEQQAFASEEECVEKLMERDTLLDCAFKVLEPDDSPELREVLSCATRERKPRTDCLEASSCATEDMNKCYELTTTSECPLLDPQIATRVLYACPDAMLLGR